MTFSDLPSDWPHLSLADPDLAADVVDLVVGDRDRSAGGLAFLLCRPDGTLAQPVFVDTSDGGDPVELMGRMAEIIDHVPGVGGLVLGIAKASSVVRDLDRQVHQRAIEVCREHHYELHGTFLASHAGVVELPVAADLRTRPGAA